VFIAKEILQARNMMDNTNYRDSAPRALDKYTCNMCSFKEICKAEMSGRTAATERMISMDYRANDYGYEVQSEQ
jgi:hypothetical protein